VKRPVLSVVLYGCGSWSVKLTVDDWEGNLCLRRTTWRENGEKCMIKSLMIYTPTDIIITLQQILSSLFNRYYHHSSTDIIITLQQILSSLFNRYYNHSSTDIIITLQHILSSLFNRYYHHIHTILHRNAVRAGGKCITFYVRNIYGKEILRKPRCRRCDSNETCHKKYVRGCGLNKF
jgi:hypothetical protein